MMGFKHKIKNYASRLLTEINFDENRASIPHPPLQPLSLYFHYCTGKVASPSLPLTWQFLGYIIPPPPTLAWGGIKTPQQITLKPIAAVKRARWETKGCN